METVFNEFGFPQNIDCFRVHYYDYRNLFELLREIFGTLRLGVRGPFNATEPQNNFLFVCGTCVICQK